MKPSLLIVIRSAHGHLTWRFQGCIGVKAGNQHTLKDIHYYEDIYYLCYS